MKEKFYEKKTMKKLMKTKSKWLYQREEYKIIY